MALEGLAGQLFEELKYKRRFPPREEAAAIKGEIAVRGLGQSGMLIQAIAKAYIEVVEQVLDEFAEAVIFRGSALGMGSDAEVRQVLAAAHQQMFDEARGAVLDELSGLGSDYGTLAMAFISDRRSLVWQHLERKSSLMKLEEVRTAEAEDRVREQEESPELFDDLLPLYRRSVFDRELPDMAEGAGRHEEQLSLVMIDLDRFKAINDAHGHGIGDEVLLGVARMVRKRISRKGKAYRWGGEEFAVLLPNYSVEEAVWLAELLRRDIESAVLSRMNLKVTASFGVATLPEHSSDYETLFSKADSAMYEAKELGRNYVRVSGEAVPAKPSPREITRREPEPGGLSEGQKEAIRRQYFQEGWAVCPNDQARLEIHELRAMGLKTPGLLVSCPLCGLDANLPGRM